MPLPKTPPTEAQWAHIFGMLEGGWGAVQRAYTWFRTQATSDMCLRTFKALLSKEKARRLQMQAAPPAVPIVDGVPLQGVGASLVAEGATAPPAAHGGRAAPPARSDADADPLACASEPPADLSDGSDQPPLPLQTVNAAPCTRAPPPPADAGAWEPGATCPVCGAECAAKWTETVGKRYGLVAKAN